MTAMIRDVHYKDKLPWRQVLSLSSANFSQAVMLTTPFTIGVFMVRDFETAKHNSEEDLVDEQRVGRLTGLLAGMFAFSGFLTAFAWGCASNYIGRKPVIVVGNAVSFVSILWFGLAGGYGNAMAARAFGGFLNGILGAWKTMIGESTDVSLQGTFFGYMSLAWGLGCIAGPALGGAFARPCVRYPQLPLCGAGQLLQTRPYFLACLIGSLTILSALAFSLVFLEETLSAAMQERGLAGAIRRYRHRSRRRRRGIQQQEQQQRKRQEGDGTGDGAGRQGDVDDADADADSSDVEAVPAVAKLSVLELGKLHQVVKKAAADGGQQREEEEDDHDHVRKRELSSLLPPPAAASPEGSRQDRLLSLRSDDPGWAAADGASSSPRTPSSVGGVYPPAGRSNSLVRLRALLQLTSRIYVGVNPFAASRRGSLKSPMARSSVGRGLDSEITGDACNGVDRRSSEVPRRGQDDGDEGARDVEDPRVSLLAAPVATTVVMNASMSEESEALLAEGYRTGARSDVAASRTTHDDPASGPDGLPREPAEVAHAAAAQLTWDSERVEPVGSPAPTPAYADQALSNLGSSERSALLPRRASAGAAAAAYKSDCPTSRIAETGTGMATTCRTAAVSGASAAPSHAPDHTRTVSWILRDSDDTSDPLDALLVNNDRSHQGDARGLSGACGARGGGGGGGQRGGMNRALEGASGAAIATDAEVIKGRDEGRGDSGPQEEDAGRRCRRQRRRSSSSGSQTSCDGSPFGAIGRGGDVLDSDTATAAAAAAPASGVRGADETEQQQQHPTLPWYRCRQVVLTILGYGLTALIFCALDEVFPIYAAAPRASGGLGMSEAQLAPPLMFFGAVLMPYSLYGYPPLQRRLGTLFVTRVGLVVTVVTCFLVPLVASLWAASGALALGTLYTAMFIKAFAQCNAFTGSIIAVNAAPSQEQLGAVNGVGQTLAALVRGVGPAMGGVLWAASLGLHTPGQQFLTFGIIAAVAAGNWGLYGWVRLAGMQ